MKHILKAKKRFLCLLLAGALAACLSPAALAAPDGVEVAPGYDYTRFKDAGITLNVYNWGEYISNGTDGSMDVVKEFENLTGIRVNYTTYDTNESLYAKLKSGGGDYDIIIPSDYMIGQMINEGMLEKLDFSRSPTMWGGTRKIRAISLIWNFLVSRNCACSGEMPMGVYFMPSSSTAILLLLPLPPKVDCQLSRTRWGSLMVPGCSSTPPGAAPLAKNFAPYSSQAIAMPMAFFAIAMGE